MSTWILPVQSRMSRKISLPALRWSMIRPAARTLRPVLLLWGGLQPAFVPRLAASDCGLADHFRLPGADLADRLVVVEATTEGIEPQGLDLA